VDAAVRSRDREPGGAIPVQDAAVLASADGPHITWAASPDAPQAGGATADGLRPGEAVPVQDTTLAADGPHVTRPGTPHTTEDLCRRRRHQGPAGAVPVQDGRADGPHVIGSARPQAIEGEPSGGPSAL